MELSIGEMLMIALVIVVLFGPDKLPQIARDLGQGVRKMKGAVEDIKTEILQETENPVSEIKREIANVKKAAMEANPADDYRKVVSNRESEPIFDKEDQFRDDYKGPVSR